MAEAALETPLGRLWLVTRADAVVATRWHDPSLPTAGRPDGDDPLLVLALAQVEDYFAGRRQRFDLPIAPHGSAFQRKVWRAVAEIPFGAVETYGSLARRLGNVAAQAIGQACGRNPVTLLVPCHRVVAAGPRLGGYGGAAGTKRWLLAHEGIRLPP